MEGPSLWRGGWASWPGERGCPCELSATTMTSACSRLRGAPEEGTGLHGRRRGAIAEGQVAQCSWDHPAGDRRAPGWVRRPSGAGGPVASVPAEEADRAAAEALRSP